MQINYENGRQVTANGVEIDTRLMGRLLLWNAGKQPDGTQSIEFMRGVAFGEGKLD